MMKSGHEPSVALIVRARRAHEPPAACDSARKSRLRHSRIRRPLKRAGLIKPVCRRFVLGELKATDPGRTLNKPKVQKNGEPARRANRRFPLELPVGYKTLTPGHGKAVTVTGSTPNNSTAPHASP